MTKLAQRLLAARRRTEVRRLGVLLLALAIFGAAAHAAPGAFGSEVGPPAPRISSAPPRATVSRAATFDVDAARSARLECSLDSASFISCPPRTTYRGLALGSHAFQVRARAASGATSPAATYEWRIVSRSLSSAKRPELLPRPVMTAMPTRPYVSPSATFAWKPRGRLVWPRGTTFRCALDGRPWRRCASPRTYAALGPGRHVFRVRAVRNHMHSRQNRFTWMIELGLPTAPTVTRSGSGASAVFDLSADGAAGFECRLDGADWTPCSSPVDVADAAPGDHELCVRGVSPLGISGPATCTRWTVAAEPSAPSPPTPSAPAAFSISGDVQELLAPGVSAPLHLTVTNPNSSPIVVGEIVVSVRPGSSKPACDAADNLDVTQSNAAAPGVEIVVPAASSVVLPAQGATAPSVTMRNLAASQNSCKNATFTLDYAGKARQGP